jgi:hypothetical protein
VSERVEWEWKNERGGVHLCAWSDIGDWWPSAEVNWRNFCLLTLEGEKSDYKGSWEIHIGVLGCHVLLTRWRPCEFVDRLSQMVDDIESGRLETNAWPPDEAQSAASPKGSGEELPGNSK